MKTNFKKIATSLSIIVIMIITVFFVYAFNLKYFLNRFPSKPEVAKEYEINQINELETKYNQESAQVDTSNWQTYRNDEYGFEVRYPKGWSVQKSKSFSPGFSLGPVDCKQTPERCPFDVFIFIDEQSDLESNFNVKIINKNSGKQERYNAKNSVWMDGMITGCYISTLVHGNHNDFNLEVFYSGDDPKGRDITMMQKLCESNKLGDLFDGFVSTIQVLE